MLLGNARLLEGAGIDAAPLAHRAEALRKHGETVMFLAIDGKLAGLVAVADPIKPTAEEAIAKLHGSGPQDRHGDRRQRDAPPRRWPRELGIDEVHAEVRPEDKLPHDRRLAGSGEVVAMAGDGINDAPALAAPMSASPWAPAPTWRWRAPGSRC